MVTRVKNYVLYLLIATGIYFRVQELGYANLQGDEINPLDYLYGENFWRYIFAQKRGPIQYLINYFNTSLFGYVNEFQIRLPYLLLALAAFVTLYWLAKQVFDKQTALWTLVLLSINGLFVAFSRIAQYQAFIFFTLPLAAWLYYQSQGPGRALELSSKEFPELSSVRRGHSHLIASAVIYAFALLAHYDALTLLPFFLIIPFMHILHQPPTWKKQLKDTLLFLLIAFGPVALFYTTLYFNPYFQDVASVYLERRLLGGGLMPRFPDVMPILSLYVPKHYLLVLVIGLGVGLLSLLDQVGPLLRSDLRNCKGPTFLGSGLALKAKPARALYTFLCLLLPAATIFGTYPIKPRTATVLVLGASLGIVGLLTLSKKADPGKVGVVAWALFAYCVYFFLIRDPRTHVYTAFLPGFILVGYGINRVGPYLAQLGLGLKGTHRISKGPTLFNLLPHTFFIAITAFLLFQLGVIYQMFVDKSPEYPWWDKELLGWPIYQISKDRHKKVEGVFGVPYYRGWERIAAGFEKECLKGSFYSNEKDSISYFYLRQHQDEEAKYNADNIILTEGPHSWDFRSELKETEKPLYTLAKTIESKGVPVTRVYRRNGLYPDDQPHCEF